MVANGLSSYPTKVKLFDEKGKKTTDLKLIYRII
jgi:hypothetical protein